MLIIKITSANLKSAFINYFVQYLHFPKKTTINLWTANNLDAVQTELKADAYRKVYLDMEKQMRRKPGEI